MTTMNLSSLIADYEPQSSPFATHVNLLRAVGSEIRTVLELGAGEFSTPLFLDKRWYPKLEWLVTVEHNADWANKCYRPDDPRHHMYIQPEPIEPFLGGLFNVNDYDFIFIDNSASGERRCATISWVAGHVCSGQMVVAHDWDVASYREAGAAFSHQFVDDRQEPWTALLWR